MLRTAARAAALLALSGCSLLLSDDLSGSPNPDAANDASTDAGDVASNDGGGGGGDATIDAPQATPRRPVGPLKVTVVNGNVITATVDGFFQIEYTAAQMWKPARLFDLGLPGTPNLAPSLFEPFSAMIENEAVGNASDEEAGYFDVVDETPARFRFATYAHHRLPSGADAKVLTHWSIYASGRLFVRTRVLNDGSAPLALPQGWIHSSFAFDAAKKWSVVESSDKRSATFFLQEPSGLGMTAVLHETDGSLGSRSATERHWFGDARTLAPTEHLTKTSELQLGVTPEEATARIADTHAPELGMLSDVVRVEDSDDPGTGAYLLEMVDTKTLAKFELVPTRARAYPAFEIRDLPTPMGWRISLDGQLVASSEAPVTPLGAARYVTADNKLVFVYLGTIPANASAEQRTFTLERPL